MLLLQVNDRYDYVVNGLPVVFAPHKHDKPYGTEPVGSECSGCIEAQDKSELDVRFKGGTLKEQRTVDKIDLIGRVVV